MKHIFRDALRITNNNLILALPVIVFVKLIDLYSMFSKYQMDSVPKFLIASITMICIVCVFCSSWFYMVKKTIELSKKIFIIDSVRIKETLGLFKSLLEGVGKYFLSFLGAVAIYVFIIQIVALQIVLFIGTHIIGFLDSESMQRIQEISIAASASNTSGMAVLADNMTPEMVNFFGKWILLFMLVTFLVSYLLLLWIPEIIYKELNPVKALCYSIVKLYKTGFETFGTYILLWITGFVIMFTDTFSVINPLFYFIMNLITFYFFVYMVVTIFLYYDRKFENEKK